MDQENPPHGADGTNDRDFEQGVENSPPSDPLAELESVSEDAGASPHKVFVKLALILAVLLLLLGGAIWLLSSEFGGYLKNVP